MSPEPAARRTLELVDELGLLWGPAGRVSLSVHHLPHDVLHALGGRTGGYRDADGACLTTRLGSPLGWEVVWFADADPACEACRALLDGFDAATDANAGAPPDSVGPPPGDRGADRGDAGGLMSLLHFTDPDGAPVAVDSLAIVAVSAGRLMDTQAGQRLRPLDAVRPDPAMRVTLLHTQAGPIVVAEPYEAVVGWLMSFGAMRRPGRSWWPSRTRPSSAG